MFKRIFSFFKRPKIVLDESMINSLYYEMLKDRVAPVDAVRRYGTADWAVRDRHSERDVEAALVNANVYIATRAITDAVKSLPVYIATVESLNGVEREVEDTMHEANFLLKQPNPEHSWSDVIDFISKCYLNDGNGILTIEPNTGPNGRVEIWPRDPRNVDINVNSRAYRFGAYTANQITYPRERVIHIRDMNIKDPLWGVGRVSTVREEILMDWYVKTFNSKFFKHGASLNLMFTPDHNLTDDQHQELIDALSADLGGVQRAFTLFVNKYGGKLEFPDQKHKDIAFLSLLKNNREVIFGVFGLPPFRGGVMEYANYANALQQDVDFWLNTIRPILKVIEDAFNKQLLWPRYGENVRLRFSLTQIPALRGSESEQIDRLIKLKNAGIVSDEYVRKQLSIDESDAPAQEEERPVEEDDVPTKDEQGEVENVLQSIFQQQRVTALTTLARITAHGSLMTTLCDPDGQAFKLYNTVKAAKAIRTKLHPCLRTLAMRRGITSFKGQGIFNLDDKKFTWRVESVNLQVEDIVDQTLLALRTILNDADVYGWTYPQLQRHINGLFSRQRGYETARSITTNCVKQTNEAIKRIKETNNRP